MKIAILADIHGNSIALDAVIQDIDESGGVDEYWILGDLVALGADPVGVLERLEALPKARSVRGNTDRFVVSGELPWTRLPDAEEDPALFQLHFRIARSFAWTAGAVAASGRLAMLRQLPLEIRLQLPDGTRVLAVHAQPGADDGTGIHPKLSDEELAEILSSSEADLVFVGEAPGEEEDLQGKPFVGLAGQLLTRIIESIGLGRDEVYIANVVKCRPPHNRNPKPEEIAACEPYLLQQLEIIKPKLICALGTFAAQTLLKTAQPISILRGRFHWYHNIKLMPTFHPAYLLRNPSGKKIVWQDMQLIKKELLGR